MEKYLNVVSIRLMEEQPRVSNTQIQSLEDAVKALGDYICGFDREVLCVINRRSDGRPVNLKKYSKV